jgi:hypothetical protein
VRNAIEPHPPLAVRAHDELGCMLAVGIFQP